MNMSFFRTGLYLVTLIITATMLASPAFALRVSPLYVELESSGSESYFTLQVGNPEDQDVPIEIFIERITVDDDGSELSVEPADDDFIIFPPQVVVPANSRRAMRLQYIGDGNLQQSAHYRAVVSKVPVELEQTETEEIVLGINLVIRFGVTINVTPANAVAEPSISFLRKSTGEDGADRYVFRAQNSGNRHFYLSQFDLVVGDDGETKRFIGEGIRTQVGGTLVPAGGDREFELFLDGVTSDSITVRLD